MPHILVAMSEIASNHQNFGVIWGISSESRLPSPDCVRKHANYLKLAEVQLHARYMFHMRKHVFCIFFSDFALQFAIFTRFI